MTSMLRRTFAAAVLTTLAIGPAGAANAQSLSRQDAERDVRSFTGTSNTTAPETATADGDILVVRMTHTDRRIEVRIQFADLQKTGDVRGHVVRVVTNEGVHRDALLVAGPQFWAGRSELDRPNGNKVRCSVRHSIDYTAHVVTIGFPRSCVSNPRWVRLGVGSFTSVDQKTYVDDALLANKVDANTVVLSPRLKRG